MKNSTLLWVQRALLILAILSLLLAIIPALLHAAPPQETPIVYYVQYGDTLFSIARRFGTSVPALMQANALWSDYIYAGQRLVIPIASSPQPTSTPINYACKYSVQYRDTIYSIAYRYQIPWYNLMQANYLYSPFIFVGQQLNVPCLNPTPTPFPTYIVQPYDNLFRIAIQYETSIYAIALVNGIPNPNWIRSGQNLVIPYPHTVKYPPNIPTRVPPPTATATITGTVPASTPTPTATATGTTTGGTTEAIVMSNLAFIPNSKTIARGTKVRWTNSDGTNHTVTSGTPGAPDNIFRSSTLAPGQSFEYTFNTAGTYRYFCEIHGAQMTGQIIVQ
jgi:LysM repeat protein